ncbi:FecR family protein [Pedobacter sp. UBA5917]|uniref:FecR family protein n=1 Tax=Pedobacter sp. UBA5917 TaxID=1947061 RepID=UPI0025F0B1BE|nr:FecR family protein [Pedobacter sp. UBA5917]
MQQELIKKYLEGTATEEERTEVELWYASVQLPFQQEQDQDTVRSRIYAKTNHLIASEPKVKRLSWLNWRLLSAAAAIVLIAGIVFVVFNNQHATQRNALLGNALFGTDIAPGGDQAILTLADGRRISLDTAAEGKLAGLTGVQVSKTNGVVVYSPTSENASSNKYNTLSTPKGAKYELVLPDGSHVWLNALSSIRYPEVFSASQRNVEVKGEAYFEVAHLQTKDKKSRIPFIVQAGDERIEVLGTHFNVRYYQGDPTQLTTLLEGAVKVSSHGKSVLLSPGEAAGTENGKPEIQKITDANTELAVAWKEGEFQFEDASVPEIMNQIARWYDVEVIYQGEIPQEHFSGKVSRTENLSQVIEILKRGGIRFKINERKITVY